MQAWWSSISTPSCTFASSVHGQGNLNGLPMEYRSIHPIASIIHEGFTKGKLVDLSELGPRICVLGPSNSGKSTLAAAIGRKRGIDVIHLDQLYHLPHSDWQPRPPEEFLALHEQAIQGEQWVMEGNYSSCMPQRFEHATGVILLDVSTAVSLFRYVRRTLFEKARVGGLEGNRERIKGNMIRYIALVTPLNRRRYADIYRRISLPKIYLSSPRAINHLYRAWGLGPSKGRIAGKQ
jgi:adenylate kinase family enzyme